MPVLYAPGKTMDGSNIQFDEDQKDQLREIVDQV